MIRKALVPIVILAAAGLVTVSLLRARPEVEKVARPVAVPLVQMITVTPEDLRFDVTSSGTVTAETEADLVSEIAGSITWVSRAFVEGGFFRRGEELLRVDPRDYQLAVASARAQISQAQVTLTREQAELEVALEEWQDLGTGEPGTLVLREPQLQEARARIEAAEAMLAKAELDLERTVIKAPFDGRVREKRVDLGEFVNRGSPLAMVYSVDAALVRLSVPDSELAYLDLPLGIERAGSGPPVTLTARFAGADHTWDGEVVRTGGAIDPQNRTVPLIVRVRNPYRPRADGGPPLAVGLYVTAEIFGRTVSSVYSIPRSTLRGQESVLVIDADDRLRTRRVEVLRTVADSAVVRGLEPGSRVCLNPLDSMIEGTKVQPFENAAPAPAAGLEVTGLEVTVESGG